LSNRYFHFFYKDIRNFIFFKKIDDLPHKESEISGHYDLIVSCSDHELKIIKDSNLSESLKLKILPVIHRDFFKHLCSKIELSKIFKKNHISSPAFKVVKKFEDINDLAKKLGYPVLLKIDYSGGGAGTFRLNHSVDILNIPSIYRGQNLLLQKYIDGKLLDISGFYQKGRLVHFSFSEFIETATNPFGPSIVKKFDIDVLHNKKLIQELSAIGLALGLHGFTNVGCIESSRDSIRYYFEVDARPNDWINYPSYFGDDPAPYIRDYFSKKVFLKSTYEFKNKHSKYIFANPSRLNFYQLMTNQYEWVNYSSFYSLLMHKLSLLFFSPSEKFKNLMVLYIKPRISSKNWIIAKKLFSRL
jgi:predicted ATP-grasp superfamily ATP-dependent carboligase